MSHKILVLEITDEEYKNLMDRIAERGRFEETTPEEDNSAPAPGAPEVDKRGVPWNADFHAASKAVTAEGAFRRKRGAAAAAIDAYEAPYIAANAGAAAAPVAAPAPVMPTGESVPPVPASVVIPAQTPGLPAAAAPLPMPTMPAVQPPVSYEDVVSKFNALLQSGKVDASQVGALYTECGFTDPNVLINDESMRRKFWDILSARG
ncbi:hypothetical protein HMSP1_62 [Sinorhizobium phage HMSP1-Susan]|nr:hypothetical protein HMSP1_62 [Sinorhizobium phage HMSP1-Susan]